MVLIYMNDGECIEIPNATAARRIAGQLLCYDRSGREVGSYHSRDVVAFTANPEIAAQMEEEVCDDVTIAPARFEERPETPF